MNEKAKSIGEAWANVNKQINSTADTKIVREVREEGVYYPDDNFFPNDCCEKCHDVTFEKTYPAHTAYHACLNLKCECHNH